MQKNIIALAIVAALVMPAMAYAENELAPVLESTANAPSWKALLENKPVRVERNSFIPGTIKLQPQASSLLDEVVGFAKKYPDVNLEIIGYARSKANPALSIGLADTIKNYLVTHGVAGTRLTIKGESAGYPSDDKQVRESRANNRFVEIYSINKGKTEIVVPTPAPVVAVPVPVAPAPEPVPEPEPKSAPVPVPQAVAGIASWKTLLDLKPVRIERASFIPGTIKLQPQASPLLDELAAFAAKYPDAKLEIIGYAKSKTNPAISIGLADTIMNYLVAHGVAETNLTVRGESAGYPVGVKPAGESRANNRFVEIILVGMEKNKEEVKEEVAVPTPAPDVSVSIPVPVPVAVAVAVAVAPEPVPEPEPVPAPEPEPAPAPALPSIEEAASWKTLLENEPIVIGGENFDRYSEMPLPQANVQLDEIVSFASKYPTENLQITGYAISPNSARSLGLADEVKIYLVRNGVASNRITIKGEKIDWPSNVRQTKDNRALYRRVEILLATAPRAKAKQPSLVVAPVTSATASSSKPTGVAGTLLANASVFGQINASYDIINTGTTFGTGSASGISANKVSSNNSRLGVKGKNQIAKSLDFVWQIELTVGTDTGASGGQGSDVGTTRASRLKRLFDRDTFVGLASPSWGKLLVGRHDTPYKLSTRKLDVFADGIADNRSLMGTTMLGGAPGGVVVETFDSRLSNQFVYFSPKFSGYSVLLGYANLSENINNSDQPEVNGVSLAGVYESDKVYATLAYEVHTSRLSEAPTVGVKAAKLGIGYKLSFFDFGFMYEQIIDDFGNVNPYVALTDPFNPYDPLANPCGDMSEGANCSGHSTAYLSMKINVSSRDAIKLAYTKAGQVGAADSATGAYQFSVGYDHVIDKRTTVYSLYTVLNNDMLVRYGFSNAASSGGVNSVNQSGDGGASPAAFSFGIRHSF